MASYRLLARNASANLVGRLASIFLALLVSTVLFRQLGAGDYGVWSLLVTVAGYSMLFDFGLGAALERRVAALWMHRDGPRVSRTLTSATTAVLLVLAVAQVLVVSWLVWLAPASWQGSRLAQGLAVLPLCTAMSASGLVMGAGLAGLQRMTALHGWRVLGLALGSFAVLSAVLAGVRRIDALLGLYCAGSLVTAILQWRTLRAEVPALRLGLAWDGGAMADLFRFGSVLQVATMGPPLAEYAFRLVLGTRFGLEFAGIYDLAARAAMMLRSLAGALFSAMVPFGVHTLATQGAVGAGRLVRRTVKYSALFVWPASALFLAQSDTLVGLWLGGSPEAHDVRVGFEVLLVVHALGSLGVPIAMLGRAMGRPAFEAVVTAAAFALAVVASRVVPSWAVAFGVFWGLPAVAGFVLWGLLAWSIGVRFESGRDLAAIGALTAMCFGIARGCEILLATMGWPRGVMTLAGVTSLCVVTVVAGSVWLRVLDAAEWAGLRSYRRRLCARLAKSSP